MEFVLDRINIEYGYLSLYQPYRSGRDPNVLRFCFYADTTVTMGIMTRLKQMPQFAAFMRSHMAEAIHSMSDEHFELVKVTVNEEVERKSRHYVRSKKNVAKMAYTTMYGKDDQGRQKIVFTDTLQGYVQPIETKADLLQAICRMSSQSFRK